MSRPRHRYVAARPAPTPPGRMGPRRWAYHQPVYRRSTLGVFLRRLLVGAIFAILLGVLATLLYKLYVDSRTGNLIYAAGNPNIPQNHVALVFGAGLNASGGPSAVLYDRVETAANLYKSDLVNKLLMTGDNSTVNYSEVGVMRETAIELGVPAEDIVLDYAGFSTWDSCYRAREVFGLGEATLVTQRFHLPRALHTCNELGVKAIGVVADQRPYRLTGTEIREYVALAGTAGRFLLNDKPRFLGPKIDVDNPGEQQ